MRMHSDIKAASCSYHSPSPMSLLKTFSNPSHLVQHQEGIWAYLWKPKAPRLCLFKSDLHKQLKDRHEHFFKKIISMQLREIL